MFFSKIKDDWIDLYSDYGKPDNILGQTNLALAIRLQMISLLPKMDAKDIPSKESINNYLNLKGFGKRPKVKTIEIFCLYLGFQSIKEFEESNFFEVCKNSSMEKELAATSDNFQERKNTSEKKDILSTKSKTKRLLWISIFLFCTTITLGTYLFLNSNKLEEKGYIDEKEKIQILIKRANRIEFSLYNNLPDLTDTFELKKIYTSDSKTYRNITKMVLSTIQQSRHLDKERSNYQINENRMVFNEIAKNTAEVSTIEGWNLFWLNSNDSLVTSYTVVNKQKYSLIKVNKAWKISGNEYVGNANK